MKELPPVPVNQTPDEEMLSKILALTKQMQQRNAKAPVPLSVNHNSKMQSSKNLLTS